MVGVWSGFHVEVCLRDQRLCLCHAIVNFITTNQEYIQKNLIHNVKTTNKNLVNSQLRNLFPFKKVHFMLLPKLVIIFFTVM
jgi:hypothetical protein